MKPPLRTLPFAVFGLACAAPAYSVALAEEAYDLEFSIARDTRHGRPIILANVATNLPDQSVLRGMLYYQKSESRRIELESWRQAVTTGKASIPLDGRFGAEMFPGTYLVTVTFDPASQDSAVRRAVGRKVRAAIVRERTLDVGGPDEAKAASDRRRAEWLRGLDELAALNEDLALAFHLQVSQARPTAWSAWLVEWQKRLEAVEKLEAADAELKILPFLNACRTARDDLARVLRSDVLAHCEAALRAGRPDPAVAARVDPWLDYYRRVHRRATGRIGLARPDGGKAIETCSRLEALVRAFADWHAGWKASAPDHAAADWPAWRDQWRDQIGLLLLRLAEEGAEGPDADLYALTQSVRTLEEAGSRAIAGEPASAPLEPALAAAHEALAKVGAKLQNYK